MTFVLVGCSGGVDSSVVAYLLKKKNRWEVALCHLLMWQYDQLIANNLSSYVPRTQGQAASLSQNSKIFSFAEHLEVPLYEVDIRKDFFQNI